MLAMPKICMMKTEEDSARVNTSLMDESTRARILANTVSVDEYFDELLAMVLKDRQPFI